MHLAALCLMLMLATPAAAQQQFGRPLSDVESTSSEATAADDATTRVQPDAGGPLLDITFPETDAIPGQPLTLRLTVLVPSYLPEPPVWPSLEAPNLLVRLPERSSNPTSTLVDGATWSGVTRVWRISPMVPGDFIIPSQDVVVTYADPDTNDPVRATLRTPALGFAGTLPPGAEGLDPFIAANSLELTQTIDGDPGAMVPGDSISRRLVATVTGTSPMFLPDLLAPVTIDGIAAYPDEPVLAETTDDGTLGGSRTESMTLVAEGGGSGEAPAVALDWYNLATGTVETATVDGFALSVDGPPARSAAPHRDWRTVAVAGLAALVASVAAIWLLRRATPFVARLLATRRAARLASEKHAYAELRRVVARRDHAALRPAIDLWAARLQGSDPGKDPQVLESLTALGRARYGPGAPGVEDGAWRRLADALSQARRVGHLDPLVATCLPSLNQPVQTGRHIRICDYP